MRSITNVYAYLLSSPSPPLSKIAKSNSSISGEKIDPESYYLSESTYIATRNRLLNIEGQILNALGFVTHVALPHPLAVTYLQTLDVFSLPEKQGKKLAKRTVEYLNTALLSPQMLYLTHQPSSLATAAIYLAAREIGVKMPDVEWWEVFDCEREELGFLVVGMGSLAGLVEREAERWGGRGMISRLVVRDEVKFLNGGEKEDEEMEMGRLMDEKVLGGEGMVEGV